MDVRDVIIRVAQIEEVRADAERAHSYEDRLHQDVLGAVAVGVEGAQQMAIEALKTNDIGFARWCA